MEETMMLHDDNKNQWVKIKHDESLSCRAGFTPIQTGDKLRNEMLVMEANLKLKLMGLDVMDWLIELQKVKPNDPEIGDMIKKLRVKLTERMR